MSSEMYTHVEGIWDTKTFPDIGYEDATIFIDVCACNYVHTCM